MRWPNVHTQTIEGYWSLVKRSIYGAFYHTSDGFLLMDMSEMNFRHSRREIMDAERFAPSMSQVGGKRLQLFCKTPQPENPHVWKGSGTIRGFAASSNDRG